MLTKLLFETCLGEWLLAFLDRRYGLAVVRKEDVHGYDSSTLVPIVGTLDASGLHLWEDVSPLNTDFPEVGFIVVPDEPPHDVEGRDEGYGDVYEVDDPREMEVYWHEQQLERLSDPNYDREG